MKLLSHLLYLFLFTSISFSQIVDVFFSDYYIGWRGGGVYNNLFELYNPKEDTVNLADYVIRRSQNGSEWRSSEAPFDAADFIRVSGIIPPGETFAMTRTSADEALTLCANRLYDGGEAAGYIDPDAFIKQSGDDALGIFYIGGLGSDTASWVSSGSLLDVVGTPGNDPGNAWDVSGVPEATRYHILQRKFSICGGNGGNWNESRGCVDDDCSETSYATSEWEVINCALADPNGSLYPEPETSEASADMQVVCGGHQYFCLSAPNSPPGEFTLESPVSNSYVSINDNNLDSFLSISWGESYDSDGHDLFYKFNLFTPTGDTLLTIGTENETNLSIPFQDIKDLLDANSTNSIVAHWNVFVTDIYDTTGTNNGPFMITLAFAEGDGLDQPPGEFRLTSPEDYSLFYLGQNIAQDSVQINWTEAVDPDSGQVSYLYILSRNASMEEADTFEVFTNSIKFATETLIETFFPEGSSSNDLTLYWNVSASDGAFESMSDNGPFLLHIVNDENPAFKEETYLDLFISDWYVGFRGSPTYNTAVELYNPKNESINLSNYVIRRTSNGSHWMETSWVRLDGILPANSTYVISREASDQSLKDYADFLDPDDFLKHTGDDGFKITTLEYLPESMALDTMAWLRMSLTLDAIGYADNDPGSAWDVSGVSEATRYYILTRNADICGGNGGDWNTSRGCVNNACDSTSTELGEWTAIQCGLSPAAGDMPEGADAGSDAIIFCGNHNYFCSLSTLGHNVLPQKINLHQNYPNPFNPKTEIQFDINLAGHAMLKIYNIRGQEVITLMSQVVSPGFHKVSWNGVNANGKELSSGMYFYELVVGDISLKKKLVLLK